jgi:hypothetical protein
MDEIRKEELRSLAEEILSGGKQAVKNLNFAAYTLEELKFLEQAIDESISQDLNKLIQDLEADEQN